MSESANSSIDFSQSTGATKEISIEVAQSISFDSPGSAENTKGASSSFTFTSTASGWKEVNRSITQGIAFSFTDEDYRLKLANQGITFRPEVRRAYTKEVDSLLTFLSLATISNASINTLVLNQIIDGLRVLGTYNTLHFSQELSLKFNGIRRLNQGLTFKSYANRFLASDTGRYTEAESGD